MRGQAKYCFLSTLLLLGLVSTFALDPKLSQTQSTSLSPSNLDSQFASPDSVMSKSIHSRNSKGHSIRRRKRKNLSKRALPALEVLKCDGSIYRQSHVDEITAKACVNNKVRGAGGLTALVTRIFSSSTRPFPSNNNLFIGKKGLTMTRISNSLFSGSGIKSPLKIGKNDYVILDQSCRRVAVVRQISNKDFAFCSMASGTP